MKKQTLKILTLFSLISLCLGQNYPLQKIPGTPSFCEPNCFNQHSNNPITGKNSKIFDGNGSVNTSYTASACGLDYTYHSASLHGRPFSFGSSPNTQPYAFTLSGIPSLTCASILKAFVYANFEKASTLNSVTVTLTNPSNVTSNFSMTLIGTHQSSCWGGGPSGNKTFRADVTSAITGNGTYTISGLPVSASGPDCNGFTILVIWQDPTQNWTGSIVIADGTWVVLTGIINSTISGFNVCGPVTYARNFVCVGDFQKMSNTPIALNASSSNTNLAATTQSVWNYVEANVAVPTVGQNSAQFIVGPNGSDCFQLCVAGMYYRTTCSVCPSSSSSNLTINVSASQPCSNVGGSATVTSVSGSPGPFTYTWLPGNTNGSVVTNLSNGTYTVLVSDGACAVGQATVNINSAPASFSLVNPSNDYTLTCSNPQVLLTTSVTNGVPLSYTWSGCSSTPVTGSTVTFTAPCVGNVVGTSSTGCTASQTFQIFQNISAPSVTVTPTVVTVNCNTNTPVTFTAISNLTTNVVSQWYVLNGNNLTPIGPQQGSINILNPTSAGTYVATFSNALNGCSSSQTVLANFSAGLPLFTVTSISNFTIGCGSTSVTSIQVSSVETTPVPGGGVQYAFSAPGYTGAPNFTNIPTLNGIAVPGTYTVYVKDVNNQCVSMQQVNIIQNTIAPVVNYIQSDAMLNCNTPSLTLTGVSSNTNAQITWTVPTVSGSSVWAQPVYTVYTNSSVSNATSNITVVGAYTVGASDPNNQCRSTKTVQVLQDIRLPVLTPTTSPQKITCKDPDVVILNAQASHTLNGALFTTYCWIPPSVTNSVCNTQMNTSVPGVHTCIATSYNNGCSVVKTYTVLQDIVPPALVDRGTFTLDCSPNPTVLIQPQFTGTTTGFTYSWTAPSNVLISNPTASYQIANGVGIYKVVVTNTLNGCVSSAIFDVIPGTLTAQFTPDKDKGFAPLSVQFSNLSTSSSGSSSITCLWNFSNGQTSTQFNSSTTFNSPGIYTVVLIATKGPCQDTSYHVITVESPSSLEVPNIFTPNGDGVNDVFRLIATQLKNIRIIIFDRWGNRVYEVESETGNIAWDGKNLQGKECAAGVYFYVLTAKGQDDTEYEKKGNITLSR